MEEMRNDHKNMLIHKNSNTATFQFHFSLVSQSAITCSKLTIETLEQGVKYVQS